MSYLENKLDKNVLDFLNAITSTTETFLFSGVIRNYFLKNYHVRDLDLVVGSDMELEAILTKYRFRKNSFGGYKVQIDELDIDLWGIDKTWAITSNQTTISWQLERYIPSTAFFNFSAVVYSLNEKRFLCANPFLSFLNTKAIDVVYEPNANRQLCLVNSLYYADKYKLNMSNQLKDLLKRIYRVENNDYAEIQIKHFGKELYPAAEIARRIEELKI